MFRTSTITALAALFLCASHLRADVDVQEFTDAEVWKNAVGSFNTIDFTGGEQLTSIDDDYQAQFGVTFENALYYHHSGFLNDEWGLRGFGGAWVEFDEPQFWIGADHPGDLAFDLYNGDELIYSTNFLGMNPSGLGHFAGLILSEPFDRVYLHRVLFDNIAFVDDLHFGTIVPAPGALGVFALAALCGRSRRRTVRAAS